MRNSVTEHATAFTHAFVCAKAVREAGIVDPRFRRLVRPGTKGTQKGTQPAPQRQPPRHRWLPFPQATHGAGLTATPRTSSPTAPRYNPTRPSVLGHVPEHSGSTPTGRPAHLAGGDPGAYAPDPLQSCCLFPWSQSEAFSGWSPSPGQRLFPRPPCLDEPFGVLARHRVRNKPRGFKSSISNHCGNRRK